VLFSPCETALETIDETNHVSVLKEKKKQWIPRPRKRSISRSHSKICKRTCANLYYFLDAAYLFICFVPTVSPQPHELFMNMFKFLLRIFGYPDKMDHFVTARETCIKFLGLRQWASQRDGEEGFRPQSQDGQNLSAVAAPEQLIFKTSTEKQTVYLTNKDLTKDSERFSPWLHSAWRTTGPIR
jgi:hypothetical protein